MVDLLMPLAVFGSLVLIVGQLTRLLSNISLNRTLREALRTDPASVPLLARHLDARQPWSDALIGWIFLAFAVGLVLLSLFESAGDRREALQAALVPAIVGVVVLLYVRRAKADAAPTLFQQAPPEVPVAPVVSTVPTPRGRRTVRKPA